MVVGGEVDLNVSRNVNCLDVSAPLDTSPLIVDADTNGDIVVYIQSYGSGWVLVVRSMAANAVLHFSVQVPSLASVPCANSRTTLAKCLDPRELLCGLFRLCRT